MIMQITYILYIYPHMHAHVRSSLKLKRKSEGHLEGKVKSLANVIVLRIVNAQSECTVCNNSSAIGTYEDKKPKRRTKGRYLTL